MPRKPREKNSTAIYHIMCRSFSEAQLFRDDEDKDYYLKLLKINSSKCKCSVYAYCLMNNHLHIHLDPKGYDISSFMHSINTSYVIYYNKKYERHGHLLQERFGSKIVDSDSYNLALSAYIHNNPKDIEGYKGREEEYKYSSYGIYLGIRKDFYRLVDLSFIRSLFGIRNKQSFIRRYKEFVSRTNGDYCSYQSGSCENTSFAESEYTNKRRILSREIRPVKAIAYIASKLNIMKSSDEINYNRPKKERNDHKAFIAYVLRVICGMRYRQICEYLFDITASNCSKLCNKGYELLERGGFVYADIFNDLINPNLQ
jgi:REP element-mobilizing transposase RayT